MKILFSTIDNRILGTHSWTEGFIPLKYNAAIHSEKDALARALWLERNVSSETGLEFLDDWLMTKYNTLH